MYKAQKILISLLLLASFVGCGKNQKPSSHTAKIDKLRQQKKELMGKIDTHTAQITEAFSASPDLLLDALYTFSKNYDHCEITCSKEDFKNQLAIFSQKALKQLENFSDKVENLPDRAAVLNAPARVTISLSENSSDGKNDTQFGGNIGAEASLGSIILSLTSLGHEYIWASSLFEELNVFIAYNYNGAARKKLSPKFAAKLLEFAGDVIELIAVSGKIGKLSQEE